MALELLVVYSLFAPGMPEPPPSIRPMDALARSAYERGLRESRTFRELAVTLQHSDLIVHIVTTQGLPSQVAGATRFVADRGTTRYVRIQLAAALAPKARVSVLAHELQHAAEIAKSGARSSAAVAAFYRARGTPAPTMDGAWETTAAALTERRVWIELGVRATTRAVE